MKKKIGILVGSLRKDSFSKKVARYVASLAPAGYEFDFIELGALPLYNQDLDNETDLPGAWREFRETARLLDAFLFVTPEYNRSIPGVLKNALDVGSRPMGASVWNAKPGAIISVSPGRLSAFGANHHLRQIFVFLNVPIMAQPEAYLGEIGGVFDANGNVTDERTKKSLHAFMDAYIVWINRFFA